MPINTGSRFAPYIAYTPEWAGAPDSDGIDWNNPPADYQDWYNFVYQLALALSDHPNVLSYEVYNEENFSMWWDGSLEQYKETLKQAALAVRAADPGCSDPPGRADTSRLQLAARTDTGWLRPLLRYPAVSCLPRNLDRPGCDS